MNVWSADDYDECSKCDYTTTDVVARKHVRQLLSDEKLKSYTKILSRCLMVSVKIFILGYSSVSSS